MRTENKKYNNKSTSTTNKNKKFVPKRDLSKKRVREKEAETNFILNGRTSPKDVEMALKKRTQFNPDKAANDPNWYAMVPELLRDAGRIPFTWSLGNALRTKNKMLNQYAVPGIMQFRVAPAFGYADSATDPLNIAAFEIYSYVRHANSGSSNYDAPDLMLYILALTQCCSYIEFLRRVYGVANVYSQRNRYLPAALIEAMNVDFESVHKNLADFRYGVNVLINKLASFAAPVDLTLFKRQAFLYSEVYTEGTSVKDQLYIYNPDGFGRFIKTGSNFSDAPAGALAYVPFDPGVLDTIVIDQNNKFTLNGKKFTVDDLLDYGRMLMQPLLESEDLNIMSGDILKAYGQDRIFKYAFVDENYSVVPRFDIGVLEQMKNAKFYRTSLFNYSNVGNHCQVYKPTGGGFQADSETSWWPLLVYQDLTGQNYGNLHSEWGYLDNPTRKEFATDYENVSNERLITTTTAEATPELVMETTRLVVATVPEVQADINSKSAFYPFYCGSDIVVGLRVFQFTYEDAQKLTNPVDIDMCSTTVLDTTPSGTVFAVLKRLATLRSFDFAPEISVFSTSSTSTGVGTLLGVNFDLDNYAVISNSDVGRVHEAAILSLLHVASIARI